MPSVRATATAAAYWGGSEPTNQLACNKPAGTAQNDVLYAAVTDGRSVNDMTTPSGWSQIAFNSGGGATGSWNRLVIFRKVAGASEPADYTFTTLAGAAVIAIIAVQDAHTTNLEGDIQAAWDSTLDYNWNTPSVDPVDTNELLLSFAANECTNVTTYNATPPSGITEIVDLAPSTVWAHLHVGYQNLSSGDPTGTKTWVQSNQGGTDYYDRSMGINITVRPAAAAPVTIDANRGNVTITGQPSGLQESVNAALGTINFTSPRHNVAEGLLAQVGAFQTLGLQAEINEGFVLDTNLGQVSIAAQAVQFDEGLTLQLGSLAWTGLSAAINASDVIQAAVVTVRFQGRQSTTGQGNIINAASPSQADVAAAIALANAGDTVQVPPGAGSWSGLSLSKAITLQGAGVGLTNITLTGLNTIVKQAAGITRVKDFSFSKTSGGNESHGWEIGGSWLGAQPVIIQNCDFTISASGLFQISVAGGVIIAGCNFVGEWDDSFIRPKETSDIDNSWSTADTMGMNDVDGKRNIYIEDCTFYGGTNQGIDADDASRVVCRYNDFTYSSFNSHGWSTSPQGVRHWEVYNNNFYYPAFGGSPPQNDVTNQSWMIWIRGAEGVIFNNYFDDIASGYWGDKSEIHFSIRGAEDARPQGTCLQVSYPVPRQIGQGHNGANYITGKVFIWNNTGTQGIEAGWNWGNPCGFTFTDFWQSGRDYEIGSAKPGYTPYTYPHPLVSGTIGEATVIGASVQQVSFLGQTAAILDTSVLPITRGNLAWSGLAASILSSSFVDAKVKQVTWQGLNAGIVTETLTTHIVIDATTKVLTWQAKRAWLTPVVGDLRLKQALREAYASAPPDVVLLDTIEIWHPNFSVPIRVVRNYESFTAKLESTAPRNAGQAVLFTAFAFEIRLPEVGQSTNSELELTIDNVDKSIVESIDLAMTSDQQIEVIYRPYLANDTTGPQMDPPIIMYIKDIEANIFQVKARCDFGDVINRRFPFAEYTLARFPGLLH